MKSGVFFVGFNSGYPAFFLIGRLFFIYKSEDPLTFFFEKRGMTCTAGARRVRSCKNVPLSRDATVVLIYTKMSPLGYGSNHQGGFKLGYVFGKHKKFEDPWTIASAIEG